MRSGVNAVPHARRRAAARTDARTDARTPSLIRAAAAAPLRTSSAVHAGRDAASLSVVGHDLSSPGERGGARRDRVVKLTPGPMENGGGFRSA